MRPDPYQGIAGEGIDTKGDMTLDLVPVALPSHVRATVEGSTLMEVRQGLSAAITSIRSLATGYHRACQGPSGHRCWGSSWVAPTLNNPEVEPWPRREIREKPSPPTASIWQVLPKTRLLGNVAAVSGLLRHLDLPCAATASAPLRSVQAYVNGFQTEHPDRMEEGYPFTRRSAPASPLRPDRAVPYDIAITGYGTKTWYLRLWKARSKSSTTTPSTPSD